MPDPTRVRFWLRRRIGYGNLHAPLWFIGMEESCNDALAEIDARLVGGAVEDVWDAHLRLAPTFDHLFAEPVKLQPTWRPLIAAALTATGHAYGAEGARDYQAHHFGRKGGETLLAELLPLPSPSASCWPYGELPGLPELNARASYAHEWLPRRVRWFSKLIRTARPRAVVAYGSRYLEDYRALFPANTDWRPLAVAGEPWAQIALIDMNGVRVAAAITPHPVAHGTTNAQWVALGRWIGENARR